MPSSSPIPEPDRQPKLLTLAEAAALLGTPQQLPRTPAPNPAVMVPIRSADEREQDITARFKRETAKHEMTVLHDDGLYRHLRFMTPGNSLYWFELVTAPGALVFSGDGESFVFRAAPDMFDLFRQSAASGGINADYWAEKLKTGDAHSYSEELFRAHVEKAVSEAEARYPGLRDDVEEEIFGSVLYDVSYEAPALQSVVGYSYLPEKRTPGLEPFGFKWTWEWDLKGFDWWYLFACHAIVGGIAEYDRVKGAQRATAEAGAA